MWHVLENNAVLKEINSLPRPQKVRYALWKGLVEEYGPSKLLENPSVWKDHKLEGNLSSDRASWLGGRNWRVRYRIAEDMEKVVGVKKVGKHEYVYRSNPEVSRPREPVSFEADGPWYPATEVDVSPGELVAEMRKVVGWTQRELANASGIDQPNISAIENGRSVLGLARARKLGKAMGVSARVFLR